MMSYWFGLYVWQYVWRVAVPQPLSVGYLGEELDAYQADVG